jgi:hypothetical protein
MQMNAPVPCSTPESKTRAKIRCSREIAEIVIIAAPVRARRHLARSTAGVGLGDADRWLVPGQCHLTDSHSPSTLPGWSVSWRCARRSSQFVDVAAHSFTMVPWTLRPLLTYRKQYAIGSGEQAPARRRGGFLLLSQSTRARSQLLEYPSCE